MDVMVMFKEKKKTEGCRGRVVILFMVNIVSNLVVKEKATFPNLSWFPSHTFFFYPFFFFLN